jgi:hypothetical protein
MQLSSRSGRPGRVAIFKSCKAELKRRQSEGIGPKFGQKALADV